MNSNHIVGKQISYKRFIRKVIFIITLLIGCFFIAYSYFVQASSIKENLKNDSSLMIDLIFQNLYTLMKSGATKEEIDSSVKHIEKQMPNSKITIYTSASQIEDDEIKGVFETKEAIFMNHKKHIDFVKPIIFKQDCISCHTNFSVGDVGGVIQLEFSILDLGISLKDILVLISVLFAISIGVLFVIFYSVVQESLISPIQELINEMKAINTHKDLNKVINIDTPILEIKEIENVFNAQNQTLLSAYNDLEQSSITDSLTNVYNRKKFDETIEYETYKTDRYNYPLCLVVIDLDKFKYINDNYGHNVGDEVLIRFAQTIKETIRQSDLLFRTGGDEFVLLLPFTDSVQSHEVVKNIRRELSKIVVKYQGEEILVEASFGVAEYNVDTSDIIKLVKIADERMYEDKKTRGFSR